MGRLFGTDGARGVAITELTCEKAMNIGRAAAMVLAKEGGHKPKIIIGKDTRISGAPLEAALAAGICSVGADAHLLGVVPTPAVAMLVKKYNADAGVMISASHNSVEFNGIKLFSSTGFKLPDAVENEIEALILDTPEKIELKEGAEVGRIYTVDTAADDYINAIKSAVEGDVSKINVVIDCANGSASATAHQIFEGLGAKCTFIHCEPDGLNINDKCGSTHMESLQKKVIECGADLGLAFDGDADRCLAVDEKGEIIDGDKLLAIFSQYLRGKGKLNNDTCVVTVMSNIGFFKFAESAGINAKTTAVGDRYVLEEMLKGGFSIGGEQSGHIIMLEYANTGDGELTGAKMLEILAATGKKASELASCMEVFPQVLVNVRITPDKKGKWDKDGHVTAAIENVKKKLGSNGRILVRESGTEPLVRVMLEGKDTAQITEYANEVARLVEKM